MLRTLTRPALAVPRSLTLSRSLSSNSPHFAVSRPSSPSPPSRSWAGTTSDSSPTSLYINGEFTVGSTSKWIDVHDPSSQELLTRVPETSEEDLERAVKGAQEAWEGGWRDEGVLRRQGIMMRFQALIRKYHNDIAASITREQGKTFEDAKGDVLRGLQVVETACGLPSLLLGDKLEVSKDMDTYTRRLPLGVVAAICPFNFPAMIPLWSMALATMTGNSLILKPSERDPGASMILAELLQEAGLPKGVLQIVHGTVPPVKFICEHPLIKAVSFVGGNKAGRYVYETGTKHGKRVQANLGAKNHALLMPDAKPRFALNSIVGAAFGAAGQRCMALSTLVAVGESQKWVDGIVERARKLKVGNGFDPASEVGPLITPAARQRVEALIQSCKDEGGKILLDGRGVKIEGFPDGNWVGPTVLEATTGMECYKQEIFGPVLVVVKADSLDDAIKLINRNPYGNGASIFTQSGATARKFEKEVEAGQIGINAPIPVPLPMFSWSGGKGSVLGGSSLYGPRGMDFWTQLKTTTSLWRAEDAVDSRASTAMPTHD
ncbi:hypothetical protein JCM8547_008547 [Rhodosporidiobolus lusitaniae]